MSVKAKIPWQAKIAAKLVLSRIPAGYSFWRRLTLFEHGPMDQPSYAYEVFKRHFDRVSFPRHSGGFTAVELGPGDSLFSAMIARAFGASASYLVDVGPFARDDLEPYRAMAGFLMDNGLSAPDMESINSLEELLAACGARYNTSGLASLRAIPDESVDFVWSQAVLEHIRRAEFLDVMRELRRVIRPDGACSHRIDLKDHLGGALNNLRFPEHLWESDFMANSGFYTNRIRYSEMLQLFYQLGFEVEMIAANRWDSLPTPRAKLSASFKHLPEDELLISGFDVTLRPV
jgi:SAM-dependent methyltransferase